MPITEEAIQEAKTLLKTPMEKIAEQEIEKRGGLAAMRSAVRDLNGLSKNSLESLADKLPGIVRAVLDGPVYRRLVSTDAQLSVVLFGSAEQSAVDFLNNIQMYRQQLQRLTAFVESDAFTQLIQDQNQFHQFQKLAAVLYDRQSGLIDRYANLRVESDAYNQLVQRLFPGDYPTNLRIDDHHLIEDRTYTKFQKIWQLIGWKSADDMAAIPLMYEFHIRSPKTLLPGIKTGLDDGTNLKSLTGLLKDAIKLDKINNTDQLLNAYEDFYRSYATKNGNTDIWVKARTVIKAVRLEISKQETLAKGFKSLK